MSRELTNRLLIEESKNFPLKRFLKADGSINVRKINQLHPDFRQDARDMIFLLKAMKVHGEYFGYEETVYLTNTQQVKIYCPECEDYFTQTARIHLSGGGCPNCKHRAIKRETEYGTFQVPCAFYRYRIEGNEIIFYSSRGSERKFSIVKPAIS